MQMDEPSAIRITIIEAKSEAILSTVLRELNASGTSPRVFIENVGSMGDINYVSGQAGAVGSNASSRGDIFVQASAQGIDGVDMIQFAQQLEMMRIEMKRQSGESPSAEQDDEVGNIARAQIAAQKGDKENVMAHLKQAGAWTIQVAKDTGAEIVALTLAHLIRG